HEQAFDLETELHRRAEHCFQASSRMPVELTAKLLQASAEAYLAESEWRRAARQCERIDGLRGNDTSVEVLITWAEALDLSGRDGAEARSRAFDRCVANADWERAAAAALSGLPGAEHTGGDPVRRSQLERIRLDALAPGLRFRVVCQLSRLSSLEGDANAAHHWSAVALELADDEAERATAHITADNAPPPSAGRPPVPPDTLNTAGSQGRIRQMQAISAFEANDLGESRERHHEFVERAEQLADPLRIWHARCFSAVLAMGDGDLARSLELAESAYEFGTQHGFREAASARVAHLFVDALDRNALDSIAPMFDQARNNLSRSLIGQAALSVVDVAQGTEERGRAMAVRVANNALDSPGSMALPAIAIVASVVAEAGDEKLRRRCRRFLAPFESTSIVMGFGIGALGPCSRFIAELAGDAEERTDSLMRSVSLADQLGARYWRVLCRLRLADHVDDSTIRDVAR
ncbi:MAG: hypothetical protein R2710_31665, partial [Acidimicrobiales bacterium]